MDDSFCACRSLESGLEVVIREVSLNDFSDASRFNEFYEWYGSASKYTVIFEANQPMLKDPDKIYPGQSLRIPAL